MPSLLSPISCLALQGFMENLFGRFMLIAAKASRPLV